MNNKDKRILITGATGLVGSHMVKHLIDQGYSNVMAGHRKSSFPLLLDDYEGKYERVLCDINNLGQLDDCISKADVVIHTAAYVSMHNSDAAYMMKVNIEGTVNMVNYSLQHGIDQLIHVSSVAAIGRNPDSLLIRESNEWIDTPYNTPYAVSKREAELEVRRGAAEGLKVSFVNPTVILGPGDWTRSSLRIMKTVAEGIAYYPSGSNGIVDARDVAMAIEKLMVNKVYDRRFIICGNNVRFKDLIEGIAKRLNVKAPEKELIGILRTLAPYIESIRARMKGNKPLINKETVRMTSLDWEFDNSRSRDELVMTYINLDETLDYCCNAWLAEK